MEVERFCHPFLGRAYRVIPDGPPGGPANDPLDATFAANSDDNRWNRRGEPTRYLAGDSRVMAAEWARHVENAGLTSRIVRTAHRKRIYEIDLVLDAVLDLRQPSVCAALRLLDAPTCFLSKSLCHATASDLRRSTRTRALFVPSVALLDQLDRWVMVLFVDKFPSFPWPVVTLVKQRGTLPVT